MLEVTNETRAQWAEETLDTFRAITGVDTDEDAVADLLADLRHYCDANGFDYATLDDRGGMHYTFEVVEERQ